VPPEADPAAVADLFEELAYAGEVTADGHYLDHSSWPTFARVLGGPVPDGIAPGVFRESRIHPDDLAEYHAFNRRLLGGEEAEVTYRLIGLDGVTRILWDRARPTPRTDGRTLVQGIVSDVTVRAEADERFSRLLDVVGEHVYLALAHLDGRIEELFQGPGADRLLGGAEPDAAMENWNAAVHPQDRLAYEAFNRALAAGEDADVEYRLVGADGVTRWVHDRAAIRRRSDGTIEVSGIVSDVTERRRMRAELAEAHAALSRVVEAMDDHLYTLEVRPDGTAQAVYRGPNREALAGGPVDDELWAALVHPDDRERWRSAMARLPQAAPIELEYRVIGVDAAERIVLDQLRPRREADGTLFYDCVARWGGEEFAVLLQGVRSDAELDRRAERLRQAVARTPVAAEGVTIRLTISVGAARAGRDLNSLDALVEAADRCLYAAKRHGRNRVSLAPHVVAADVPSGEPAAVAIAQALACAAALRERVPEAHADHVADLAMRTAERMALPATVVLRSRLGGWLHDVGKAAVPAHVLDKPGPLDEGEWRVMRTHPAVGEAIVRRVPALRDAAAAVRHHHERYDGRGYPDGLAGAAIPIEARIVAAADAYAAMTAERAYSAARTPEEAAAELRRSAGSHLDPAVVAALLAVLDVRARTTLKVA
jgi:PAS domain S-box-containing protein